MVKRKRQKLGDDTDDKPEGLESSCQEEESTIAVDDTPKDSPEPAVCAQNNQGRSPMAPSYRSTSRVTAIRAIRKLNACKDSKTSNKPTEKNSLDQNTQEEIKNLSETEQSNDTSKPINKSRLNKKNLKSLTPEQSSKKNWTKKLGERAKRPGELWTSEDKNNFFEALSEYGKDFESVQSYLASKSKRKGISSIVKNKEQVRHFYYRTWHKISKHLELDEDINKQTLELYGLLNYAELRKKVGGVLNPKNIQKLNELITTGSTFVRFKGKRFKVKTPLCPALKKINNLESLAHDPLKLPKEIYVEFRPATNQAWLHVQNLSQNPRVRTKVSLQRRLKTLIEYLQSRWKPSSTKRIEDLKTSAEGDYEKDIEQTRSILRLYPPKKSTIKIIKFDPLNQSLCSNIDLSLKNYKKNCVKDTKAKHLKSKVSSPKASVVKLQGDKAKQIDQVEKDNSSADEGGDPHPEDEVNKSLLLLNSMIEPGIMQEDNQVETSTKTPSSLVANVPPSSTEPISIEDIYLTAQNDSQNLTLGQILSMAENNNQCSQNQEDESPSPDVIVIQDEDQVEEMIAKIRRGWTFKNVGLLTIGQLYLMQGCPTKIELEYDWEIDTSPCQQPSVRQPAQDEASPSKNDAINAQTIKIEANSGMENNAGTSKKDDHWMSALIRFCSSILDEPKEFPIISTASVAIQVNLGSPSSIRGSGTRLGTRVGKANTILDGKTSADAKFAIPATPAETMVTYSSPSSIETNENMSEEHLIKELKQQMINRKSRFRNNKSVIIQRPLLPKSKMGFLPSSGGASMSHCPTSEAPTTVSQSMFQVLPILDSTPSAASSPPLLSIPELPSTAESTFLVIVPNSPVPSDNPTFSVLNEAALNVAPPSTTTPSFEPVSVGLLAAPRDEEVVPQVQSKDASTDIKEQQGEKECILGFEVESTADYSEAFKHIDTEGPVPHPSIPNQSGLETPRWINNEINDFSLGSLFDSPLKDNSIKSTDIMGTLNSLMTENSTDYAEKFSDLNKLVND
ncbi:CRAMP1L [Cordylochernes scorpioides]|uniref:CRAMP1L n=1 Tax=Cordylochernes scorpioides TaxID=51811 RepID=A0ABY6KJ02_9ARAC|nr:CRAMP1L [Cordylochernes scorpioides]